MPPAPARVGPANANAAIFSDLPAGTAGFDDVLDWLAADKDAAIVRSTSFITWKPVPAAAAGMQPTKVAAPRCIITATACLGAQPGTDAAAQAAWRAGTPLTTHLSTACGQRPLYLVGLAGEALLRYHADVSGARVRRARG